MTDAELDRLEALLAEREGKTLPLDAVQGLACAIASGPEPVEREAALEAVLGEDPRREPEELVDLVEKLFDEVQTALREGEGVGLILYPLTENDDTLDTATWCRGYLEGVDLSPLAWEEAAPDADEFDDLVSPILVLAGALDEDPALREEMGLDEAKEAELIEDYAAALPDTVQDLHDYWARIRLTPETFRREAPKVGRNDPCPCGSGKKYKQCHGAL